MVRAEESIKDNGKPGVPLPDPCGLDEKVSRGVFQMVRECIGDPVENRCLDDKPGVDGCQVLDFIQPNPIAKIRSKALRARITAMKYAATGQKT